MIAIIGMLSISIREVFSMQLLPSFSGSSIKYQLAIGISADFLFDAGGVKIPGGHGGAELGAGDASCLIIVSAASNCSRLRIPLS